MRHRSYSSRSGNYGHQDDERQEDHRTGERENGGRGRFRSEREEREGWRGGEGWGRDAMQNREWSGPEYGHQESYRGGREQDMPRQDMPRQDMPRQGEDEQGWDMWRGSSQGGRHGRYGSQGGYGRSGHGSDRSHGGDFGQSGGGQGQYGGGQYGGGSFEGGSFGGSSHGGMYGRERSSGGYGQLQESGSGSGERRGRHAGKGPKGYKRKDETIVEEVSQELERHHDVDASEIEVSCDDGVVTLKGSVEERRQKRMAEDCAEDVYGVKDVVNELRVKARESSQEQSQDGDTSNQSQQRERGTTSSSRSR